MNVPSNRFFEKFDGRSFKKMKEGKGKKYSIKLYIFLREIQASKGKVL